MKVVIVEDESLAVKKLESLLYRYSADLEVVARLASVRSAVEWFSGNPEPELIFMDVHLEDGLSFGILELQSISAHVIFTTAFDEFSANAFKGNEADFLLKPINFEDLERTLDKALKGKS
ncbi:MAG TPA: response regulator [Sphingobacteriaceae bacterium]